MFKYVHLCPRYLAGAPLAQPPVPLHGRDKPVALLRHYWAFSSSVLLDWLFLIFLLKISHRIHMGLRSGMLSGQSSTVRSWSANHLEVVLAVWAGAKVLLEKEISISTKLVSRCKHKVLQNLLVDWCIYFELDKTQWTNASRHHSAPNHHWLWKLHTGLQAAWILCLSTLPPDSVTLISKLNAKFLKTLDRWETVQLFFFSPGKMLLIFFQFQKWLGSPFSEDVWAWLLLMHSLQLQFTPCEALPSVWISFACQHSQACSHPCCLYTFSYQISSIQSTLHLICFDTALLEQPPLSLMTFCDLPSLWRVSMIVFWTTAKSVVFPIIVVSKNKRYPQFIL